MNPGFKSTGKLCTDCKLSQETISKISNMIWTPEEFRRGLSLPDPHCNTRWVTEEDRVVKIIGPIS